MKLLALLHRWTGGLTGLLLAVIGLSGAVLVWEDSWIGLPGADDPLRGDPASLGAAVAAAAAAVPDLARITFADEGLGLHQAIGRSGAGAYLTQGGEVVERWDSNWGRPELWLFDLHHFLLLGEDGKYVTGVLGVLLLGFTASGLVLWWRTRRTFRLRAWPLSLSRGSIVRHHRDIGTLASPLLIVAALTGVLMVFKPVSNLLLLPFGDASRAAPPPPAASGMPGPGTDWTALFARAQGAFPEAAPRRLMLPAAEGKPVTLRLRQPFEWTPNGRSYVYLDGASGAVLAVDDPAAGDAAGAVAEKYYPVHAGKVGGFVWQLALTAAGLVLALLGTLASYSFWFGNPKRPAAARTRGPARQAGTGAIVARVSD